MAKSNIEHSHLSVQTDEIPFCCGVALNETSDLLLPGVLQRKRCSACCAKSTAASQATNNTTTTTTGLKTPKRKIDSDRHTEGGLRPKTRPMGSLLRLLSLTTSLLKSKTLCHWFRSCRIASCQLLACWSSWRHWSLTESVVAACIAHWSSSSNTVLREPSTTYIRGGENKPCLLDLLASSGRMNRGYSKL